MCDYCSDLGIHNNMSVTLVHRHGTTFLKVISEVGMYQYLTRCPLCHQRFEAGK